MVTKKNTQSWSDLKTKLANVDRAGLLSLVKDLYTASKDNQAFLHARFAVGEDVLKPYKVVIDRWLYPDYFNNQDTSVSKAKKAIADYKKAIGAPVGTTELMVFFCERAAAFSADLGLQDEAYFDSMLRMYEQALNASLSLTPEQHQDFIERLIVVRENCQDIGYGVSEEMDDLLGTFGIDE